MGSRAREPIVKYRDVVRAATHLFVEQGVLDMQELADTLAIGRATLYRLIAGQDQLLGDVLWVLTDRTIDMATNAAAGAGVDRLLDVSRHFHSMVRDFEPLRRLTTEKPDLAFRVLFTPAGGVHQRTVDRWTQLLDDAEAAGELKLPVDAAQFAEMFVRLGESMLWTDLLGTGDINVDEWDAVRRSLFAPGL